MQFDSTVYKLAEAIQAATLHDHVFKLATWIWRKGNRTERQSQAAVYIASQFKKMVSFNSGRYELLQEVSFSSIKWSNLSLNVSGTPMEHMREYVCNPQIFPLTQNISYYLSPLPGLWYWWSALFGLMEWMCREKILWSAIVGLSPAMDVMPSRAPINPLHGRKMYEK